MKKLEKTAGLQIRAQKNESLFQVFYSLVFSLLCIELRYPRPARVLEVCGKYRMVMCGKLSWLSWLLLASINWAVDMQWFATAGSLNWKVEKMFVACIL